MPSWLIDAGKDLRFAARTLGRHPGFALTATLTLALGIGANTAIFTMFDAILLRHLPVREPSRLVMFKDDLGTGTSTGSPPVGPWRYFSTEVYRDLRDQRLGFSSLAAVRSGDTEVLIRTPGGAAGTQAERGNAQLVSGNYFDTMGVDAALGRTLTERDDRPDAPPVTVLSDRYWRGKMGADRGVIGSTVVLNATAFTVVGVTAPEFFGERVRRPPDFWMPLSFQPQIELRPSALEQSDTYWLNLIGRRAPGVSMAQAQTATTAALQRFLTHQAGAKLTADRRQEIQSSRVELSRGANGISGLRYLYSQPLRVLLVVVGLVLLIACANVANLLLTRAASRRGEISMRIALGAGRGRLIRQLLTESLLLAALGAVCGVILAGWITRALMSLVASPTTPVQASLNAPVLAFTLAIALAAGLLFGIAPALQASRIDLVGAMKARQGSGSSSGRVSRAVPGLVAVQIAVSLVLLVGAGLFARTLVNVERAPLGFVPDHVLLARVNPRLAGYKPQTAIVMYPRVYERLGALPGVQSVTMARYSPLSGTTSTNGAVIDGYTPRANEDVAVENIPIGPSYAETMGMRLVQGRGIGIRDIAGRAPVAMVNQAFVRRYLPTTNPLGRHIGFDTSKPPDIEIVGVLGDAQFHDARKEINPIVFTAMAQGDSELALDCEFAVRTAGDPSGAAAEVREAIAGIDPGLPVNDPRPLAAQVSNTFDTERLAARLVTLFGVLALLLAAVGLYGTFAQTVAQRTNEIGVRIALGAARGQVVWMILRQMSVLVLAGIAVGVPVAAMAARIVSAQLFGVKAIDAVSFGAAVGTLVLVSLLAGFIPARRVTRIDPVVALRAD
jgi:predicted permease